MSQKRKSLSVSTRMLVLHESGYKCANPVCRTILTLDIHHLEYISDGGDNSIDNLLAICPNCHALHHRGVIPVESLRAWKLILLSLNEGFDKNSIDILLTLKTTDYIVVSGEGILQSASLISSNYVESQRLQEYKSARVAAYVRDEKYIIKLTKPGKLFVEAWERGDQRAAIIRKSDNNV